MMSGCRRLQNRFAAKAELPLVALVSRYCPSTDPRFAYRAEGVVQTQERVCAQIGYPSTIRVDNGSEFISRDLDLWAYANNLTLDFSRPGKPTDNGFIEAFNSKLRAACLNAHWFLTLADAREKLETWRRDYNEARPHARSVTTPRSPSIIPVAQPARRRAQSRKTGQW